MSVVHDNLPRWIASAKLRYSTGIVSASPLLVPRPSRFSRSSAAIMIKVTILFILSSGLDMWFRIIFLCYCSCDLDEPNAMAQISFHSSPPVAVTKRAILVMIFAPTLLKLEFKWISHLAAASLQMSVCSSRHWRFRTALTTCASSDAAERGPVHASRPGNGWRDYWRMTFCSSRLPKCCAWRDLPLKGRTTSSLSLEVIFVMGLEPHM
ncbi:hypothetical protein F5888DRAFT_925589 [Russula emetica]|nr:hypothetical protein F5888DRAFT_925589 [Russula emetica]